MPASDMRLAFSPIRYMGMKASATLAGMVTMGIVADGMCQRKSRMMSETMMISSMSLLVDRVDGAVDELGAIVGRDHLTPSGSEGLSSSSLALTRLDDVERVLALAHDHDAADHVALAVVVGDAAAHLRAERHGRHVLHRDRRAVLGLEHQLLEVGDATSRSRGRAPCTRARRARPAGRPRRCCPCGRPVMTASSGSL